MPARMETRISPTKSGLTPICFFSFFLWSWLAARCVTIDDGPDAKTLVSESESFAGFYAWSYVYDYKNKQGFITFSPYCEEPFREKILNLIKRSTAEALPQHPKLSDLNWMKSQSFSDYANAFTSIQNYINEGDCYQVNLTQRFEARSTENAADLYFSTREHIRTPYSCFFSLSKSQHILSFSPEQFISINKKTIESRPIKGTIKNNGSNASKLKLQNSTKDLAENVMIVDLLRNDLGKVCASGTVHTPELFKIETFRNVHHLVSHIKGQLEKKVSEFEAFLSCFPGGSITGAPKVRAMEIISELEPTARGPYCGSLGYIGFDGTMDLSILIRTITAGRGWWQLPVGGGIVAQSNPQQEYEETWHKAAGMLKALQ